MDNNQADTPRIQYEYILRTEEYVPIEVVRHLLRVQGQINRLAAEQDLQILDLEAEVHRLRDDITSIQNEMNQQPLPGLHFEIVLACVVAGMAILFSSVWVAGFNHGG